MTKTPTVIYPAADGTVHLTPRMPPHQPEQPDPAAADSLAQLEARRLDSYASWLDSNQARRGELTPAEIRPRKQTETETETETARPQ